jgi:tetratricopeptide (TPR) repeat protein
MSRPLIVAALLGALLLPAVPGPARADSIAERFASGKLEFDHKNFGNAINLLRPLLFPVVQLTRTDDIVAAREMLGLAYFYVGQEQEAQEEFKLLLYLRPRHRLDPFLVPPQAVRFFDQIWSDPAMAEKIEKIEKERLERERLEAEKQKQQAKTLVRRQYLKETDIERFRIIAFLPFGLGQFQNGHTVKGILLASGGGLSLAANIVCYSLLVALANDNGKYSPAEVPVAKALRITQYVTAGVFAATWIYGVIDANIYFEPVTHGPALPVREETEEIQPTTLAPTALPGGAGMIWTGRF